MKNNELTKPELSFDEQIEKMEQDGIEFSIISKEEAKDFLQHNNYFFKLKSNVIKLKS